MHKHELFASNACLPDERLAAIRGRLERDGRVVAVDLAREFATSEDTIRRDLRELAAIGQCRRVYGGALRPVSPEPICERTRQDRDAKTMLGRAAAALVRRGQVVAIDAGSTNMAIAEALAADMAMTVLTNAPAIAGILAAKPAIDVILVGGRVDHRIGGTVGAQALSALEGIRPDIYFVGACAIDPRLGIAVVDSEEAVLKRALAAASGSVAVAVTDDKLGTTAPYRVAAWADLDHLVVTRERSLDRCGPLPAEGPAVHAGLRSGSRR